MKVYLWILLKSWANTSSIVFKSVLQFVQIFLHYKIFVYTHVARQLSIEIYKKENNIDILDSFLFTS